MLCYSIKEFLLSMEFFRKVSTDNRSFDESSRVENQAIHPVQLSNPRVTILKEILREKIKLDPSEEDENNTILKDFLRTFIAEMEQCDEIFKLLYNRVYYTGSYYSDLRISNANEFDLNLVLELPLKYENLEVEFEEGIASYGALRLKNANMAGHDNLMKKFFVAGYLIPEKIRFWLQSVVDRVLLNYPPPRDCSLVRQRTAGPARTIMLYKNNGNTVIDVDLVPVIEYTITERIPGIDDRVYGLLMKYGQSCFLVPKPYSATTESVDLSEWESRRLWRLHFPRVEDEVIRNFGCVKPVIKLLKLLRDKNDWKVLASYYLKTVVMWLILENPSKDDWNEDKMGDILIEVLEALMMFVKKRNIPYFFSKPHNLIAKMNYDHSANISCRLKRIIQKIKIDHFNLWEIFGAKPTFSFKL